ncbi:MAG TPA: trypsin-like serine protease, partial [Acidimicrobiales bacterium]|nr:trypsin-like serine protease [Acidimicrobiales bacterium]
MRSPVALLVAAALLVGGIATASADPVPPLDADPEVVPYIVGGTIVAPGTWPAMAALVQEPSPGTLQQFCGGTLIRDDLVLSAAHCTADPTFRANPRVLLGRTDLSQAGGELIDVVEIIEHPDWIGVANGFAGDLAVLRLATESVQAPTALLRPGREPSWATGTVPGTIVGWGQLEGGASDPNLREVSVTVRTDVDCEASIPTYQTGLDLCAGGADFGACFGDSGGPLYSFDASGRSVIAGVVSRGLQTCAQAPGILTRVAAFAEWVVTASLSDATARIAGADRYATAANLADRYAPGVPSVHLVSGEAFPDAVTAAAAAGRAGGPV